MAWRDLVSGAIIVLMSKLTQAASTICDQVFVHNSDLQACSVVVADVAQCHHLCELLALHAAADLLTHS